MKNYFKRFQKEVKEINPLLITLNTWVSIYEFYSANFEELLAEELFILIKKIGAEKASLLISELESRISSKKKREDIMVCIGMMDDFELVHTAEKLKSEKFWRFVLQILKRRLPFCDRLNEIKEITSKKEVHELINNLLF